MTEPFLIILTAVILILVFLLFTKRRLIYILYKTLPRDLKISYSFLRLSASLWFWTRCNETVPKVFTKLARQHPEKVALYYEDEEWTFQRLDEFSNRVGHYFKSQGYKKGDSVALMLDNRPEYVGIWLGLSKIGVVTALINTNLVSSSLVHSIFAADNKGLIFGSIFAEAISQVKKDICNVELYEFKTEENSSTIEIDLKVEIQKCASTTLTEMFEETSSDKLLYIYTSGTTGLPKAAIIPHNRYMLGAGGLYFSLNLNPSDIYYNPLPLYHSAGGMLAVGQCLLFGVPVVLRKKFSASNYWTDCRKYNCTVANYVGELCRYLLVAHKPGTKIEHKVKKVCGNGLRPQIWKKFKDTFGIEEIYEIYGATEGNSQMVNVDGKVGAVGCVPIFARWLITPVLIKCDENTGEPIRNNDGLFTKCKNGEPGLLVAKINQKQVHKAFVGYADSKESQKKILRNVLVKGDTYFNTGDILMEDEFGYFYFRDRTGDTFRWKGENVATCEVGAVISNLIGYNDAVIYGVEVPNTEGRAGMVAIVDQDGSLDLKGLAKILKSKLPSYAVPIFLRKMDFLPLTGSFKLKKVDLQKEGFNIEKIKNGSLYMLDFKNWEYVPLTQDIFDDIIAGRCKI